MDAYDPVEVSNFYLKEMDSDQGNNLDQSFNSETQMKEAFSVLLMLFAQFEM